MKKLLKPFTLIELMIVVAIIAIIAVIAVPNLMDAQRNAKERSAIGNLKSVMSDQATYHADNDIYGTIQQLADDKKVDVTKATGISGYIYSDLFVAPTAELFAVMAVPASFGSSGKKNFVCTSAGAIRYDTIELNTVFSALTTVDSATTDLINDEDLAK